MNATKTPTVTVARGAIGDPDNLASGIQYFARIGEGKVVWFQSADDRDRFIVRLAVRLALEGKALMEG